MRKNKLILGLCLLPAIALSGCGDNNPTPIVTNRAPMIVGVKDLECVINTRIDLLDGVAALDKEDGDITPKMNITISPEVEVVDGYATFKDEGTYTVTYSVTDKDQRNTIKRSFVDVVLREKYISFDMPSGFYSETNGAAIFDTCGMVNGDFVVEAHGQVVAEDVKINKKFTLKTNSQYEFLFGIESKCEGKVKVLADDLLCGEMVIHEGENDLIFRHIALDNKKENKEVTISLCFGAIENKIDLIINKLETILFRKEEDIGKKVDLTGEFVFTGKVEGRFDSSKGGSGNAFASDDGKSAILESDGGAIEDWAAGVFVNTRLSLKKGVTYTVSFDVEADTKENPFKVQLKCGQWGENNYRVFENTSTEELAKHQEVDITPNASNVGDFWIYVMSGFASNRIEFSNLKVYEHLGPTDKDIYKIEDYSEFHEDASEGYAFTSTFGNFYYKVPAFLSSEGDQKVASQSFYVNGSGANYVLTFKARATNPIDVVVATHVTGGWDPTLNWNRITLGPDETAYTLFYGGSGGDLNYTVEWQFGSSKNQQYSDVEIFVNDVSISLRNKELDG